MTLKLGCGLGTVLRIALNLTAAFAAGSTPRPAPQGRPAVQGGALAQFSMSPMELSIAGGDSRTNKGRAHDLYHATGR
jgi:hypothetical protein